MRTILRVVAASLLLVGATAASAASPARVSERSPLVQGMWWDPTRSGHGFEIFNAGGVVSVFWYTYGEDGLPIWYTAQGSIAEMGQPYPLLQHRWRNGAKDGYDTVGTLTLKRDNSDAAKITYSLNGQSGTWSIQPFQVSGVVQEVDHDGVWYDPANPGWGLSILEQGDRLGGAAYYYTPEGRPTWVAGFTRGSRTVEYFDYTGPCPYCAGVVQPRLAGTITFDFASETTVRLTSGLGTLPAAGISIDKANLTQLGRPASTRPADRQLASYDDPEALRTFLASGLPNVLVATVSGSDFSSSPGNSSSVAYSATNLQDSAVDEADVTKTDGRYVYTFGSDGNGLVLRTAEIAADGSGIAVRGSLTLGTTRPASQNLLLWNKSLVGITGGIPVSSFSPWTPSSAWAGGVTNVEILDTSASGLPVSKWRAALDGYPLATRRVDDRLYVATRFIPNLPQSFSTATPAQRGETAFTPLTAMLPTMRVNGAAAVPIAAADVWGPPLGSTLPVSDMIVVTVIDLANPHVLQRMAILGRTEAFYVSGTSVYVATSRSAIRDSVGILIPGGPTGPRPATDVHQIAFTSAGLAFSGSATVEGTLGQSLEKASFRLSEDSGLLRIVTSSTSDLGWGAATNRNLVSIVTPSAVTPGLMKTLARLPNDAHPEAIGDANKEIAATRFVGGRLYAATAPVAAQESMVIVGLDFTAPRILGKLTTSGTSEYLHPLANGTLLGFGRAGNGGLQLSLLDVRDPAQASTVQQVAFGSTGSDSALLRDHHAFASLQEGAAAQVAIPVYLTERTTAAASSLLRFNVAPAALVSQPSLPFAPWLTTQALTSGRPILLGNGAVVYVGGGYFWHQDAAGNATGPF